MRPGRAYPPARPRHHRVGEKDAERKGAARPARCVRGGPLGTSPPRLPRRPPGPNPAGEGTPGCREDFAGAVGGTEGAGAGDAPRDSRPRTRGRAPGLRVQAGPGQSGTEPSHLPVLGGHGGGHLGPGWEQRGGRGRRLCVEEFTVLSPVLLRVQRSGWRDPRPSDGETEAWSTCQWPKVI